MRAVWPGSSVRNAERTAVSAAAAAGDPDRYMRWAAHGLATAVLRHLTTGDTPPTVTAAGENHGRRLNAAGIGVAGARIVILVGPGGNGGDGLFAGAHLAARGAAVTAVPVASRVHQRGSLAFTAAGGRIHTLGSPVARRAVTGADVVIDAGFGTGARGGLPAELAEYWPHAAWVVAADAPSGLDTDTGEVLGDGFTPTADTTITFGALKTGLFLGQGRARAGAVTEVAIPGLLDPEVLGRLDFTILDEHDAFDSVLSATPNDHKYSRGVLGLLAGSPAYPGAAILAAHAALATGVGMLTSFSRSTAATQLAAAVPEAVVLDRSAQPDAASSSPQAAKVSAWLLGPGLGDASEDLDAATALLTGPG
ncbi:MAG: NAD(P)H-hydrate epimerase, partial [Galactobacter sp.]